MTLLSLIINWSVLLILIYLGIDEEFWRSREGPFLFSLWILPFLINIYVLLKHIEPDGLKKGLMTTLSLFGSVVVFIGSIVFWVNEIRVDDEEFVVTFSMFITSLMTIFVLREYYPLWMGRFLSQGTGGLPKLTSLYFKRRRLEEELRVRELEEKLNKKKGDDSYLFKRRQLEEELRVKELEEKLNKNQEDDL